MGQRQSLRDYLLEMTDLTDESSGQSIVELAGENRILIENHSGILSYSDKMIDVKVSYGSVKIEGNMLRISKMCKKQLIVAGKVSKLVLETRG